MTKPEPARAITCAAKPRKKKPSQRYSWPAPDPVIAKRQVPAKRRCIRCRQWFASEHAGHRIGPCCVEWVKVMA